MEIIGAKSIVVNIKELGVIWVVNCFPHRLWKSIFLSKNLAVKLIFCKEIIKRNYFF